LIEAAKDAGAIGDRKLPRPSKYLSAAERGLIEFLEALPCEQAKAEEKIERKARIKGRAAAEAEVAAEATEKLEAATA
jgi:hypothetical protein